MHEINSTFIDLRTDFGFKRIFGSKKRSKILLDFLNALFEGKMEITDVQFQDKEILPPDPKGKRIIYDIYCTTKEGRHIIVEMQQADTPCFDKRMICYTIAAIYRQIEKGGDYNFEPVYTIVVTDFKMKNLSDRAVNEVMLMEHGTDIVFNEDIKMLYISLPKARTTWKECKTKLEKQIYLLKNMGELDKNSEAYRSKEYPEMFEASEVSQMVNEDVVAYSQSYLRMQEMQEAIDYNAKLSFDEGMAKGIAEGNATGRAEGRAEEKIVIAKRLIQGGFSTPEISAITELPYSEIEALRK